MTARTLFHCFAFVFDHYESEHFMITGVFIEYEYEYYGYMILIPNATHTQPVLILMNTLAI